MSEMELGQLRQMVRRACGYGYITTGYSACGSLIAVIVTRQDPRHAILWLAIFFFAVFHGLNLLQDTD